MNEPNLTTDAELLRRIADGESAALGEFYDAHAAKLFAFTLRILNDSKEAEDIVQEVFLQIWAKAATYDHQQARPLAWVITMTRNRAIDRLRSAQRRARLIDDAAAEPDAFISPKPQGYASEPHPASDETEMVHAALQRLPLDQRKAIELAFFGGFTQMEIAASLNEPLGTIKARIRRGMLKLREDLSLAFRQPGAWAARATEGALS